MLAFVKLLFILCFVIAALIWVVVVFQRHFKSASITLFAEGWVLTHPHRKAVAFDNATDAKHFYKACKAEGFIWNCYALYKGNLTKVEIGDTIIY